ncbi:PLP-dependent transferase [Ramaria rubella]|nr:PLP-dependent transferase [Ramaria rubella]
MVFTRVLNALSSCCGDSGGSPNIDNVTEKRPESPNCGSSCTYTYSPKITSPETRSDDPFAVVRSNFLLAYPQYLSPMLDSIRDTEFTRLSKLVYLDYTGASLYPESLVRQSNDYLTTHVLGNPHSSNPPSRLASHDTAAARIALLQFLGADPEIYTVVWTANTSSAMRIVGEGYSWHSGSRLLLGHDSHNSLNGLRAFARKDGAAIDYYAISPAGGWEEKWSLLQKISDTRPAASNPHPGIFCLTGQSNVTGYKPPLYLLQHAASQGFHTLLDAAALAPSTKISLSSPELNNSVDAVTLSIYKIVGYPTGVGALVVKKTFLRQLNKPWFAGGTVDVAQVPGEAYTLLDGHERFEDGTINFLSMITIPRGLSFMATLIPVLSQRLACLTHWTTRALSEIKHHQTGKALVHVRSPSPTLSLSFLSQSHGALISFEVCDAIGNFVSCEAIEYGAGKAGMCLRAGCMCNPGGTSSIAGMTFMMNDVKSGDRKEDLEERFGIRSRGVVRASFGVASNLSDAWIFIQYMRSLAAPHSLQNLLDEWAEHTIAGH